MEADLFAGLAVTDLSASLAWYEQLFGAAPAFFPNDREAVFEVAPRGYVYVALDPARAGHALVTLFLRDFDEEISRIASRGVRAAAEQTLDNGVRKAIFRDADGNEVVLGGRPRGPADRVDCNGAPNSAC